MSGEVSDCIEGLDSIIREDGIVVVDNDDESDSWVQTALDSATEKFGVHFEGQEASILVDRDGSYFASSLPLAFKGTFKSGEKMSINRYIARHTANSHYCLYPGCKDPCIKSSENKFSNGQTHVRRCHPEIVPFSMWTSDMLAKRELAWRELKACAAKRKASSQEGASSKSAQRQALFTFSPTAAVSRRKSNIGDFALILVKFICLGLFPIAITKNPGFAYLIGELTSDVKLLAPNTIQRRLLKEFHSLIETRKALLAEIKIREPLAQNNGIDLDLHIYRRIFSLQYDCWTNRSSESFLGLTLFYISEKWELKSISLGCVPFGGSHTALRTLDLIKEVNYKLQTTTTYVYVADINMTFFDRF